MAISPTTLDGIEAWLVEYEFQYGGVFLLQDVPKSCPWQFIDSLGIEATVEQIFQDLKSVLPKTVSMLKNRCKAIYALLYEERWYLLYIIKIDSECGDVEYIVYAGNAPSESAQLSKEAISRGWSLPSELQTFYQVHNGFGLLESPCSGYDSVLPSYELEVLSEFISELPNVDYEPNDLLGFFPDGAGNGQYFYRGTDSDLLTVDWDHETREISRSEPFWTFVDSALSKIG